MINTVKKSSFTYSRLAGMFAKHGPLLIAIPCSLLISLLIFLKHPNINLDGVVYLRSAQALLDKEYYQAYVIYPWPFYAGFIAFISHLTSLSLLTSTYLINTLFQTLIVFMFVLLVKTLRGSSKAQWFGLLIILVYPHFNSYREYIVRDFGYWFFYLLALYHFIRYAEYFRWRNALGWGAAMMLATLFRIEGLVFLGLIPLTIFLFNDGLSSRRKITLYLKANTFLFVLFTFGATLFLFLPQAYHAFHYGFTQYSVFLKTLNAPVTHFREAALNMKHQVLDPLSDRNTKAILVFGLVGVFFFQLIKIINPFFLLLGSHAVYKKLLKIDRREAIILLGFVSINLFLIAYFLASHFFFSGRYLVGLIMIVLLLTPFSLEKLFNDFKSLADSRLKYIFPVVAAALVFFFADGLVSFGVSKQYLREAGEWVSREIPEGALAYSNSPQLLIYKKGAADKTWNIASDPTLVALDNGKWKQFDYLIIRVNKKHPWIDKKVREVTHSSPIKVFRNARGDQVEIFQTDRNKQVTQIGNAKQHQDPVG